MSSTSGKIALVTGSSRGIGRAIAIRLAQNGARVVVNYTSNESEALQTVEQIKSVAGIEASICRFDVSDSDAVTKALVEIEKSIGVVDILVNNAGIVKDGLLLRYKDEDWHRVINTNLAGAFYCARACARQMIKKRWGRIINISSVVGEGGNAGQVAYVSAKSGMIGMTKALALELASRQVTVNTVAPGYVETHMTSSLTDASKEALLEKIPLGFVGEPSDVAHAVAFLASDEARYITGHVLSVNGGLYI